ncbi:geranylgeranyl diphosphate synthase, type II [Thermotomaculum hydrothermale]|uniref:Geranylgeranyl diphosphate synthase, type II n=2 Tax=Thermotomaculum hydrothermale TaxID=981385 RepID=A0A7R6PLT4_9BACT|nr:geranylgeranyl diphosphate synthase, type II [Thermotomaculum hydrothermale]
MSLSDYLKNKRDFFEKEIKNFFPSTFKEASAVLKAMEYSFFAGGKRFRPILALTVCEALGKPEKDIIPACLAIEMIHTYSLIHDDLPAMDNDDFRRGKPSNHKIFGEGMAILAGDALLTEAFFVASKYPENDKLIKGKLDFIRELANAAGIRGMVGGQVMDIDQNKPFNTDFLYKLHMAKTGAIIRISALVPLIIYQDYTYFKEINSYASNLGLLFQITDDILDVESSSSKLGKTAGKDIEQNKLTFVTLFGLDEAKKKAKEVLEKTIAFAEKVPNNRYLMQLANYIFSRDK